MTDKLPAPEICHYCDGDIEFVHNSKIYGKAYGKWPYAYLCTECGAYVGVHPNTKLPLGYVADSETRKARINAKQPFFSMVKLRFSGNKGNAYKWLAKTLRIDPKECHFGMFDIERCHLAQKAIKKKINEIHT